MLLGAPTAAAATNLNGITTRTLLSLNAVVAVGATTVIGCDNFTGTNGASLGGRVGTTAVAYSAISWSINTGAWTLSANRARSGTAVSSVVTAGTSTANSTIGVTLTGVNTGLRFGGLVSSHNGVDTYLAVVAINGTPDRIELRLIKAGVSSVIASVNTTLVGTNTVRMTRQSGSVSIVLNSVTVLNVTLSALQVADLGVATRAGLFGGSTSVMFDNFFASNP